MTVPKNRVVRSEVSSLRILAKSVQSDYLAITESAGIRVAVHGQAEEAFADAFGYNAAAGFTTSFAIKYIQTERLPAPYGNCTTTYGTGSYYYAGDYSVEGCFRSCYQEKVVEKCGCGDPRFNIQAGKEYCVYNDAKQRQCVDDFSGSNADSFDAIKMCSCPQPCTESTYGVTVSTALWPSDVYTPPNCDMATSISSCTKWYNENTMLVEIYYERMNYQMLSESEAYTLVNLVSDMGGQLGLWLGISVITVVEFCSLLLILMLYCCTRHRNKKQRNTVDPNRKGDEEHPEDMAHYPGNLNDSYGKPNAFASTAVPASNAANSPPPSYQNVYGDMHPDAAELPPAPMRY